MAAILPPGCKTACTRLGAHPKAKRAYANSASTHELREPEWKVLDSGGRVLMDPFDVMSAGRMAVLSDAEGAAFSVWQAREHKGAQIVNEPASLNFSGLNTRDPARARSFYGSIFGWETLALGGGTAAWRLPGYGDFLGRNDPELRTRMAASGAPRGFAEVVATLDRIPADRPDVPAHWSVTFAVDDADATAKRAAELGGEAPRSAGTRWRDPASLMRLGPNRSDPRTALASVEAFRDAARPASRSTSTPARRAPSATP
jgi:predicted enzyme related to lactoylglutathione lyase